MLRQRKKAGRKKEFHSSVHDSLGRLRGRDTDSNKLALVAEVRVTNVSLPLTVATETAAVVINWKRGSSGLKGETEAAAPRKPCKNRAEAGEAAQTAVYEWRKGHGMIQFPFNLKRTKHVKGASVDGVFEPKFLSFMFKAVPARMESQKRGKLAKAGPAEPKLVKLGVATFDLAQYATERLLGVKSSIDIDVKIDKHYRGALATLRMDVCIVDPDGRGSPADEPASAPPVVADSNDSSLSDEAISPQKTAGYHSGLSDSDEILSDDGFVPPRDESLVDPRDWDSISAIRSDESLQGDTNAQNESQLAFDPARDPVEANKAEFVPPLQRSGSLEIHRDLLNGLQAADRDVSNSPRRWLHKRQSLLYLSRTSAGVEAGLSAAPRMVQLSDVPSSGPQNTSMKGHRRNNNGGHRRTQSETVSDALIASWGMQTTDDDIDGSRLQATPSAKNDRGQGSRSSDPAIASLQGDDPAHIRTQFVALLDALFGLPKIRLGEDSNPELVAEMRAHVIFQAFLYFRVFERRAIQNVAIEEMQEHLDVSLMTYLRRLTNVEDELDSGNAVLEWVSFLSLLAAQTLQEIAPTGGIGLENRSDTPATTLVASLTSLLAKTATVHARTHVLRDSRFSDQNLVTGLLFNDTEHVRRIASAMVQSWRDMRAAGIVPRICEQIIQFVTSAVNARLCTLLLGLQSDSSSYVGNTAKRTSIRSHRKTAGKNHGPGSADAEFNEKLRKSCACGNGIQIKMALSALEELTGGSVATEDAAVLRSILRHGLSSLREIADVLFLPKAQLLDIDTRKDVCPSLTPRQLLRLLQSYQPDELDPDAVDQHIIAKVRELVQPGDALYFGPIGSVRSARRIITHVENTDTQSLGESSAGAIDLRTAAIGMAAGSISSANSGSTSRSRSHEGEGSGDGTSDEMSPLSDRNPERRPSGEDSLWGEVPVDLHLLVLSPDLRDSASFKREVPSEIRAQFPFLPGRL